MISKQFLTPDIEVTDNPMDGYELGDIRESMLSVIVGDKSASADARPRSPLRPAPEKLENPLHRLPVAITSSLPLRPWPTRQ